MAFNEGKGVEPALTYCVNPEVLQQFVEFIMKKKRYSSHYLYPVCVAVNKCFQSATLVLTR